MKKQMNVSMTTYNPKKGYTLSPCMMTINSFMRNSLRYSVGTLKEESIFSKGVASGSGKKIFTATYTKTLNYKDAPIFDSLKNISCVSYIIIDAFNGAVLDHYLQIDGGTPIKSYNDSQLRSSELDSVYNWHCNLMNTIKTFMKGDWLNKDKCKGALNRSIPNEIKTTFNSVIDNEKLSN